MCHYNFNSFVLHQVRHLRFQIPIIKKNNSTCAPTQRLRPQNLTHFTILITNWRGHTEHYNYDTELARRHFEDSIRSNFARGFDATRSQDVLTIKWARLEHWDLTPAPADGRWPKIFVDLEGLKSSKRTEHKIPHSVRHKRTLSV